jgi:hypothetical protein
MTVWSNYRALLVSFLHFYTSTRKRTRCFFTLAGNTHFSAHHSLPLTMNIRGLCAHNLHVSSARRPSLFVAFLILLLRRRRLGRCAGRKALHLPRRHFHARRRVASVIQRHEPHAFLPLHLLHHLRHHQVGVLKHVSLLYWVSQYNV